MENKVIELLLKINDKLDNLETEVKDIRVELSGVKEEVSNVKEEVSKVKEEQVLLRKEMEERFDVTDIKLNTIETKVIHVSRKLDSTTDQVTRNLESIEEVKFKLQ